MSKHKVSIIIATYNRSNLLPRAIESALAQRDVEVEVIVSDDGSTDNTPQVAEKYDDRIRYIRQSNHGQAAARNAALRIATGEYWAYLDDDDMLLPNFSKHLIERMDETGADFASGYEGCVDIEGNPTGEIMPGRLIPEGDIFKQLLCRNFISEPLLKSYITKKVGLFLEKQWARGVEDYEYWLRVARHFRFAFVPEELSYYAVNGLDRSSAMLQHPSRAARVQSLHYRQAIKDPDLRLNHKQIRWSIADGYMRSARLSKANGLWLPGFVYSYHALRWDPKHAIRSFASIMSGR